MFAQSIRVVAAALSDSERCLLSVLAERTTAAASRYYGEHRSRHGKRRARPRRGSEGRFADGGDGEFGSFIQQSTGEGSSSSRQTYLKPSVFDAGGVRKGFRVTGTIGRLVEGEDQGGPAAQGIVIHDQADQGDRRGQGCGLVLSQDDQSSRLRIYLGSI